MKLTVISALAVAALFALASPAHAAKNPSPAQAASAAKACFLKSGWTAQLVNGGNTVNAQSPRKLKTYPYRPWFSVAFNAAPRRPTVITELPMGLTRSESSLAKSCARAGWR